MTRVAMLTTTDNPYDPFDEYDEWYAMDALLGYHSPSYLARIAIVTEDLGDEIYHQHIEDAIDEILEENITGTYKKVTRDFDFVSVPAK
jgi:hypothetical protein